MGTFGGYYKGEQKKRKKMRRKQTSRKKLQRGGTIFLFVFLLFFFWLFADLGKSWNGKDRLTVVLQNVSGENKTEEYRLAVISIEPSQEKGNYLYLKPNFLLDIPYGYKTYPVYSIYKLGRLDKTRGGEKLIKSSIETTLRIKTDRYLLFTDKNGPELPDRKESFNKFKHDNLTIFSGFPFLAGLYSGRVSTDMTLI